VIDSTWVKANASCDRLETEQKLRNERAKLRRQVRRWQEACDGEDPESGGMQVAGEQAEQQLAEMPHRLEKLRKSGMAKLSRSDEESRFLRERGGHFTLGYTAKIAVSDDHFIVGQRVTQEATDNASLLPMVEEVERQCGSPPAQLVADSGFSGGCLCSWPRPPASAPMRATSGSLRKAWKMPMALEPPPTQAMMALGGFASAFRICLRPSSPMTRWKSRTMVG